MRRFIIDTDPGIDDAFAIGLMMKSDIEILGITTVSGNNGIDTVTTNAQRLVHFYDRPEIKVYEGAGKPIMREPGMAADCHGSDGLGGTYLPVGNGGVQDQHAVDYLIETLKDSDGEIEILALGPLTNLALAFQKDPEAMKKVKRIYTMGGGVECGNITPHAEFNYWVDPEATKIVFESELPLYMVGLNVTHECIITLEELELLKEKGDRLASLYYKMTDGYAAHYKKYLGIDGVIIHDLVTASSIMDPEIVTFETLGVQVETDGEMRGATQIAENGKAIAVGMKVDVERFKTHIFENLFDIAWK